jgi:rare lipoprotein A (peptidoglycan hydrolase)
MALIALLVMVAVPGPVGSRVPSPDASPDPGLFHRVEAAALARGAAMTILPQDPEDRSAGTLDQTTALVDPAHRAPPPHAPVRPAQKKPTVGTISTVVAVAKGVAGRKSVAVATGGWHHDTNISWYGPGLYGNGTACGQKLTKDLVGVAHRTLPCGTLVTFRYKGVTLTVPVIDRGPYVSGRTWDLSHGACAKLHHCFTGTIDWHLGRG